LIDVVDIDLVVHDEDVPRKLPLDESEPFSRAS
jgi:hypothetical protein